MLYCLLLLYFSDIIKITNVYVFIDEKCAISLIAELLALSKSALCCIWSRASCLLVESFLTHFFSDSFLFVFLFQLYLYFLFWYFILYFFIILKWQISINMLFTSQVRHQMMTAKQLPFL